MCYQPRMVVGVGFYLGYDNMTAPCGMYGLDMFGTGESNVVSVVKEVWFLLWVTSDGFGNLLVGVGAQFG